MLGTLDCPAERQFDPLAVSVGTTGLVVFDQEQLLLWQAVTGRTFSLNSSNCKEYAAACFVSPDASPLKKSFLHEDCAGHHVWLDPPENKLYVMLQHYVACKARCPESTSACILVPRWRGGSAWRKLLSGMRLLHEYPAMQPLYSRIDAEGHLVPLPGQGYPLRV